MIYVLGSIMKEVTLEVERAPKKGEYITVDSCKNELGGKGALQAIAIAKMSNRENVASKVRFIGRVGEDATGTELREQLEASGVDTRFVRTAHRNTGMTVTTVTPKDRRTMVYGGANNTLSKTDIDEALDGASPADTLLCQLESPLYVVAYALRKARLLGMTTVLNPSPAKQVPDDFFYNVDIVIPNAEEAQFYSGVNPTDFDAQKSAIRWFHARGVQYVAISLGSHGATASDGAYMLAHIPPRIVDAVDGACAGETFVAALTLTYPHVGMYSFREACLFANKAASVTVSRQGSIGSMPVMSEVTELYNNFIQ